MEKGLVDRDEIDLLIESTERDIELDVPLTKYDFLRLLYLIKSLLG